MTNTDEELRREKIDINEQTKRYYRGVNTWYQIDGDAYKPPYKLFLLQYCEHLTFSLSLLVMKSDTCILCIE